VNYTVKRHVRFLKSYYLNKKFTSLRRFKIKEKCKVKNRFGGWWQHSATSVDNMGKYMSLRLSFCHKLRGWPAVCCDRPVTKATRWRHRRDKSWLWRLAVTMSLLSSGSYLTIKYMIGSCRVVMNGRVRKRSLFTSTFTNSRLVLSPPAELNVSRTSFPVCPARNKSTRRGELWPRTKPGLVKRRVWQSSFNKTLEEQKCALYSTLYISRLVSRGKVPRN